MEFYLRKVAGAVRTSWKLPVKMMSKEFQEVIKVHRHIQTMLSEAHNKVQNMLEAPPRASCSRQVQGCKSRAEELEHLAEGMRKEQEGTQ